MTRNLVGGALVALCLFWGVDSAWAAIGASGGGGPHAVTDLTLSGGGFTIASDVAFDPTAGPWIKHLLVPPGGGGIDSGVAVPIVEELTNVGNQAWTDWHEVITGPIEDFGFGPATDFAFERESVHVARNGVALSEGSDYTLEFTEHPVPQPMMGMNHVASGRHWQSVSLFFSPGSVIQPTDVLRIQKNIFETFFNAEFWNPFLVAEVAEHPTVPEPAAFVLTGAGLLGLVFCGRGRRSGFVARLTNDG